jgi:predicted O-methyltransferase YrrM
MTDLIDQTYETGSVTGRSGAVHELHSAIDREKGEFLRSIVANDKEITKTLEVGCAYGLSSLFICSELAKRDGASHTIIDPFQNIDWDGVGLLNLDNAGIDFYTFIEDRSEFALPEILKKEEGTFDMIFVDGFHTFDQTLLDCHYATRLLRVGGVLAIDDVALLPVGRAARYFQAYPCYETYGVVSENRSKPAKAVVSKTMKTISSRDRWSKVISASLSKKLLDYPRTEMIALKKIAEDTRPWNWYTDNL